MATDGDVIDLEQLSTDSLKGLRERIDAELDAREREDADDPDAVVEMYMEDALDYFRGRTKSPKSPGVGPAKDVHNGVPLFVCYKADTSKKNSTSRWVKINGEWIWDSDRIVAERTEYGDTDYPYSSKISVYAVNLNPGDEVEINNKKTHGSGSNRRTLYEWDGTDFERV